MITSVVRFKEIYAEGGAKAALAEVRRLEQSGQVTPAVLVQKAIYIQLSGEDCKYSLGDAEDALKLALELDGEYIEALQELAYLYYAVLDRTNEAIPFFRKALELSRAALVDNALGLAGCLGEIGSGQEGLDLLERVLPQFVGEDELERLEETKNNIHRDLSGQ